MIELNLRALAKFLTELADPTHFDMSYFIYDARIDHGVGLDEVTQNRINECGTVACAMGHAPVLFPPRPNESWGDYGTRVFGIDECEDDDEWGWCFSGNWAAVDNTPQGAGKRIIYLLDHGLPENFEDQMYGREPLCYA